MTMKTLNCPAICHRRQVFMRQIFIVVLLMCIIIDNVGFQEQLWKLLNNFNIKFNTNYTDDSDDLNYFRKCYEDLGCIETDSRWYNQTLRPVNLRPAERYIIKTEFLLIKKNQTGSNLVYTVAESKEKSIRDAGFIRNAEIIFLIHDFTSNGYTGWIKQLSLIFNLITSNSNVISVDWQRGAEPPYDQAIANARVVALEIINFIRELREKFDVPFDNIHLIGHGIGAHVAGYVGAVYNTIKKITGLDPSGPRFEGLPDIVKLNPSSAKYVEVLHTDAFEESSQGTMERMGHTDFYINNAGLQPGCTKNKSFGNLVDVSQYSLPQGEILPGCSHKRSFKYFIEAFLNPACTFIGVSCADYNAFLEGNCTSCGKLNTGCRTFGLETYKATQGLRAFYANTGRTTPFCRLQYEISVTMEKDTTVYYGNFELIFKNGNQSTTATLLDSQAMYRNYHSDRPTSYIYYAAPPLLNDLTEAEVKWNQKKAFYCFIKCKEEVRVTTITVSHININEKETRVNKLCPADGSNVTTIKNGYFTSFLTCGMKRTRRRPHRHRHIRKRRRRKKKSRS